MAQISVPAAAESHQSLRARSASEGFYCRQLVVFVFLCLLFGAAVNAALALYLFLSQPFTPTANSFTAGHADAWPMRVPASWPRRPQSYERLDDFGRTLMTYSSEPPNVSINYLGFHQLSSAWDWRCGWPMRSLRCVVRSSNVDDQGYHAPGMHDVVEMGMRRPESWRRMTTWRAPYLPTSPIPIGFAVNSLTFAAVPALPLLLAVPIRRSLRLRAGLCPRCKYPIATSPVCTECGHELSARHRTHASQDLA